MRSSSPAPAAAHKRGHHHHQKPKDVKVQLLAFTDFHGNIQTGTTGGIRIDPPPPSPPPTLPTTRPAGGAAIFGSYVRELERRNRNSLLVSAGDLIGASPLVSALYHDEPTIEAMNKIGLDLNAVGNHEFDDGEAELKRMQRGGCHEDEEDCDGFEGADFKFLAANVVRKDNAKTHFRPYAIRRFQGKKIGFIGMTLEGTPSIVAPSGIANLNFLDEAATANRYSEGRTPLRNVDELVKYYEEKSRPLRETEVGRISSDITRTNDPDLSRENALGNLIADAQLADTAADIRGNADGALMNPGGVRADLTYLGSSPAQNGIVTYEEAFTVQPFNNLVTTQTFTGAQLLDVLKDQWCGTNSQPTVLLPSSTINYTVDLSIAAEILGKPCAGAANPASGATIGGAALDPAASYRITTNNFVADGGDDFQSLRQGTNRTTLPEGRFDIDSLVDYLEPSKEGAPIAPPALDRIDATP